MTKNIQHWVPPTLHGFKANIDTKPDYQRPAVWGKAQQQLLIDTILRNYDIPKIYWRQISSRPEEKYEVVDGQQRIRAVWGFMEGKFILPKNTTEIEGEEVAGLGYENLPSKVRRRFDTYALDIVVLSEVEQEEVQEMFLRLQNGTSLRAQEKRNAYPGKMRDFVKNLAKNPFFDSVRFSNHRFAHDHVAAQLLRLAIAEEPVGIKNTDLNRMYKEHSDLDDRSAPAKRVRRVLLVLHEVFPEKTPELERYNVVALYCLISEILENHVIAEIQGNLKEWFLDFEKRRREEEEKPEDQASAEWLAYKDKVSHSNDAADSIRHRVDFMLKDIFVRFPSLTRKDNQRQFSHAQRLAVFRKGGGRCQAAMKCQSQKLAWNNWHCDHIEAWSKGGKTTVENGQATCPACNLAKGDA